MAFILPVYVYMYAYTISLILWENVFSSFSFIIFQKKLDMNLRRFLKSRDSMANWWFWGPVVWDSKDISPKNPNSFHFRGPYRKSNHQRPKPLVDSRIAPCRYFDILLAAPFCYFWASKLLRSAFLGER